MNKTITRIIVSIISGVSLSLLSLLIVISDICNVSQDTCGEKLGFPFAIFSGPTYARDFNGYEVLVLNTMFWIFVSMVIFLLIVPFVRKFLSKKQR